MRLMQLDGPETRSVNKVAMMARLLRASQIHLVDTLGETDEPSATTGDMCIMELATNLLACSVEECGTNEELQATHKLIEEFEIYNFRALREHDLEVIGDGYARIFKTAASRPDRQMNKYLNHVSGLMARYGWTLD